MFGDEIEVGSTGSVGKQAVRACVEVAGVADRIGSSGTSVVLESAKREDPLLMERLKVIWSSETFAPPPVIISNELDINLENSLREAFLKLDEDEKGREILSAIGIERFVPAREEDYQSAVELFKRYENLGEDNWP